MDLISRKIANASDPKNTGDLQDAKDAFDRGDFKTIKAWLNENIHRQGRLLSPDELSLKITGQPLNPNIFINYLKKKYKPIYGLN